MHHIVPAAAAALMLTALGATGAAAQAAQQPAQASPPPGAAPKIAFVRSQAIVAQAPGRAEAQSQYEKEMGGYRQQMQRMEDSLSTLIGAYQKAETTMTAQVKEQRQKQIRDKQAEYQKRAQDLQQQATKRERELMQPITDQISKIIEAVRAEDGYGLVLDAESGAPVILAADKSLDITDKVISRLKAAGPAAAAKPNAPATGPAAQPSGVSRTPPRKP